MPKLRIDDDRGAISTLFAIFLGSGLFFAILALVVDGGQVMVLKQLTRDGADAVAEAVAIHCAKDSPGSNCLIDGFSTNSILTGYPLATATNTAFLNTLANPKSGPITVTSICGKTTQPMGVPACPPLSASPNDCQTDLGSDPGYTDWIRVYTSSGASGMKPAFANFGLATPQSYQETACSQVYWGNANAITVDKTGGQLPFMIGICDVQIGGPGNPVQLLGEAAPSTCSYTDRRGSAGTPITATARGFLQFDPTAVSASCWTLEATDCNRLNLATTKAQSSLTYPPLSYPALISVLTNKLNRTVVLPVVDNSGSKYKVLGFVSFTLLGFRMPSSAAVDACTADSACAANYSPGYLDYGWTDSCANFQSDGSPFCIVGNFNTRVVGTYGQVPGLGLTTSANVANLGYQVIRHIR